jgi:hypothetical protein
VKLRTRYALVAGTLCCWAASGTIRAAGDRDPFGVGLGVLGLVCAVICFVDALWGGE